MKINLGCGKDIKPGFFNIDHILFKGVDKKINLNKYPYPFKDQSVEYIYAKDIIEHLKDPFKTMEELYRILKNDGILYIEVPHFTAASNYNDPTHKTRFGYNWFRCFSKHDKYLEYLTSKKFESVDIKLCFSKKKIMKPFNWFFNRIPKIYEYTPLRIIPCTRLIIIMKK